MKTKVIPVVCTLIAAMLSASPVQASSTRTDTAAVAADCILGRPVCFAATILGSAVFVLSLPVAATSGSIHTSAEALVLKPAHATFIRPLGDFSYPKDNSEDYMYSRAVGKKAPRAKTKG